MLLRMIVKRSILHNLIKHLNMVKIDLLSITPFFVVCFGVFDCLFCFLLFCFFPCLHFFLYISCVQNWIEIQHLWKMWSIWRNSVTVILIYYYMLISFLLLFLFLLVCVQQIACFVFSFVLCAHKIFLSRKRLIKLANLIVKMMTCWPA